MATEWMPVIQVGLTGAVAAIGWLMKRSVSQIDRRMDDHEARVERLEQESVSKDDWLRESGISRQRQEKILEELAELKGQNRAGVEIGAAIAAALNRRD